MDLPVDAEGWIELCVRCWDNSLNTQPTFVRSAWNWDLHVSFSVSVLAELSSDMTGHLLLPPYQSIQCKYDETGHTEETYRTEKGWRWSGTTHKTIGD